MVSRLRSLLNWLRQQFQLKPGKPAIGSSIQVLITALGPLAVGVFLGHPTQSAIAVMSAWMTAIVNVQGVYRQQATAKIVAVVSITMMLLIANLVHPIFWLSLVTTFFVMFVLGFAGVWGQGASAISLIASIMFVVGLARFATASSGWMILQQCLLCFAGGIWSIVVSLGIWQLHPYKPVVQSIANCYDALNQLGDAAKGRTAHPEDRRAQFSRFLQAQDNFTQALKTAHDRWSAAWIEGVRNQSGNQLLMLLEDTPTIANLIVTLVEQVVIVSDHSLFQSIQPHIQQSLEQITAVLQQMSRAIAKGKTSVHLGDLDRAIEALNYQQQTLHAPSNQRELATLDKICATLTRIVDQLHTDAEFIAALEQENSNPTQSASYAARSVKRFRLKRPNLAAILEPVRENLTVHSVFFRHALRLAIVVTIAEFLAAWFQIPRGYWLTLTAVVALKPNYGGTSQTTLQRAIGTVVGGVIGIVMIALIHNPWAMGACLLLLIMAAMAVRPLSMILFITLLTPAIILLLNTISQAGWQIGILRIVDSLAGGSLALLGSYLLFPRWERQQLPAQLETAIRSNLAYFQQVLGAYIHSDKAISINESASLRRQAALENSNLVASEQRLFSEPRNVQGDAESITTLVFYIRRFFNSVTALADHRQEFGGKYQCPEFRQFADTIVQILENGADALGQRQTLQPLPDLDRYLVNIHNHANSLQTAHTATIRSTALTQISRALRQQTPVSSSLEQIVYEITKIHSAIDALLRSQRTNAARSRSATRV